jgi:Domain of unknown function (DUF5615)
MPLAYVFDEHLPGALWKAIQQHNAAGVDPVDAVRVGDPPGLPRGTKDPALLQWAEQAGRILLSFDKKTLPGHLTDHLQAGHHSPGIFLIRRRATIPQVVAFLVLAAHASDPATWQDQVVRVPLP